MYRHNIIGTRTIVSIIPKIKAGIAVTKTKIPEIKIFKMFSNTNRIVQNCGKNIIVMGQHRHPIIRYTAIQMHNNNEMINEGIFHKILNIPAKTIDIKPSKKAMTLTGMKQRAKSIQLPINNPVRHKIPHVGIPHKQAQIKPNGNIKNSMNPMISGGGTTHKANRNSKNDGIDINAQMIGTANPNNAKAKQMPTPTTDRGNIKPQIKHGRTGKLQQVKNPTVKMQSPVQNSNPRQTRDAMPPRPRTVISATPASKTQVVTPQIKNAPAVMIDKNKNRIRIKRKNKAGNTIQSSRNAPNPTMIYLLF
jgi:hypothetical protein